MSIYARESAPEITCGYVSKASAFPHDSLKIRSDRPLESMSCDFTEGLLPNWDFVQPHPLEQEPKTIIGHGLAHTTQFVWEDFLLCPW